MTDIIYCFVAYAVLF